MGGDIVNHKTLVRIAAGSAVVVLASCAASTQLMHSWADPAAAGHQFKKVVVVGATPQSATRRNYEDAFVQELAMRGVQAVPSYQLVGEGQIDKDAAAQKLRDAGVDGILVTRLVDKSQEQTYYPPTYSAVAAPAPYYGGWYGYYNMGYTYMSSPGYVTTDNVYKIESNLYDMTGDKLVWSGLTQTTLSSDTAPSTEILSFIDVLTYDMEKHKVIPQRQKK
jgi:hypothetical protein